MPTIQFFNDELNATVTVRDMLSHRSGITRHDTRRVPKELTAEATLRQYTGTYETPTGLKFEVVLRVIALKQTDPSGVYTFTRK